MYTSIKDIIKHENRLEKCLSNKKFLNKGALPQISDFESNPMDDYLELYQGDICNPDAELFYDDYSCNKSLHQQKQSIPKVKPPVKQPVHDETISNDMNVDFDNDYDEYQLVNDENKYNDHLEEDEINFFPDEEEDNTVTEENNKQKNTSSGHKENLIQRYGVSFVTGLLLLSFLIVVVKHAH